MSRTTTANLALGVWDDGDNPGAGSKSVSNTGLNGNALILDTAVGTEHNADGTHKDDKIAGRSLKASIADGTTIEASAATGTKTFRVKDGGLTGVKMNQTAGQTVDGSTLEFNANAIRVKDAGITTAKIADSNVTTAKIADSNVTTAKLADDAVTAPKISHDNNRTKATYVLAFNGTVAAGLWATVGAYVLNSTIDGIPMPRAGTITRIVFLYVYSGITQTDVVSAAYGTAGYTFSANDRLGAKVIGSASNYQISMLKNSSLVANMNSARAVSDAGIVSIEVEFDD